MSDDVPPTGSEEHRGQPDSGRETEATEHPDTGSPRLRLTRRSVLRGGLVAGAGALGAGAIGGVIGYAIGESSGTSEGSEAFLGVHQPGVITNTQRQTMLASFDVTSNERGDLVTLLKTWTELASSLMQGDSVTVPIYTPPKSANTNAYADATGGSTTDDSLEAYGLAPNRLTLTIGFGRSLFITSDKKDRFGIADQLPDALIELPHFSGDELTDDDSAGDLFLQACGDDPQVVFHAIRSIARIAPDVATLRWTQVGFTPDNQAGTPRNLMGFKDGTINSNIHPPADLDATVWAGSEGPDWMQGGSYLVYRRIRMALEHWDRLAPNLQDQVIGRRKLDGAPLGGANEFSPLDLDARSPDGSPVISQTAHVRLAAPQTNNGAVILRRAFSYNNGTTPFVERWPPWRQALEYDAGLLFLAYQKDPRKAFVPIFSKMAETDNLNQFTTHNASALFAIPPGVTSSDHWIGQSLLA
jgi:deferrochelatase/peroxidase EfeB